MSLKFGGKYQAVITRPKIVIFGVGGGGSNAVNHMVSEGVEGVHFVISNTDAQVLESSICENKIQLGAGITSGLGAGSVPEIGKRAAEESANEIEDYIRDAQMVFVACGMGGGTGTGAAPVIAKIAKERGILTIGVVTKPFTFEGQKRMKTAEEGIIQMRKYCDTVIVIANQNLFRIANATTTLKESFKMADDVLVSAIRCITDLITYSGLVNLDFADVCATMSDMEHAVMGEGLGEGEDRDTKALENAMTNPLLEESSIKNATGILLNICGGHDLTLYELQNIVDRVTAEAHPNANIKFGSVTRDDMAGKIKVSLVATQSKKFLEANRHFEKSTQQETQPESRFASQTQVSQSLSAPKQETQSIARETFHQPVETSYANQEDEAEENASYSDSTFAEDSPSQQNATFLNRSQDEEDAESDYFSSFYSEKPRNENDNVAPLNEFLERETFKGSSGSFVPKKVVNIEEAINKNRSSTNENKAKFDLKSIFRINKGA